jgi:hypothetical protein
VFSSKNTLQAKNLVKTHVVLRIGFPSRSSINKNCWLTNLIEVISLDIATMQLASQKYVHLLNSRVSLQMSQAIDVQELAFVINAKQHAPAMLNLEFLRCSGIIPTDWELLRQPIQHPHAAQLMFQNGVSLTAQANQVIFAEPLGAKALDSVVVAEVACKYVAALPHAQYSALGMNVKGFAVVPDQPGFAHHYLMNTLLAPGEWQNYGQEPVKAGINFVYTLEEIQLYLSINEVTLQQQPDGQTLPSLMFDGNFEHRIVDGLRQVIRGIQGWQNELSVYRDLINSRFLANSGDRNLVPNTIPLNFASPELATTVS